MPSQEMIDKHGKRLAYYIYHKRRGTLKSQKKKPKRPNSAAMRSGAVRVSLVGGGNNPRRTLKQQAKRRAMRYKAQRYGAK